MSRYAKLRSDLVSTSTEIDGQTQVTIKDPITGTYFRLREPEFWLINQLDGTTPPEDIAARFTDRFGLNITTEQVCQFVAHLEKLFFLEDSRSEQEISRACKKAFRPSSLAVRLMSIRIKAFKPGRLLDWLTTAYKHFHGLTWFALGALVTALGVTILTANYDVFFSYDVRSIFSLGSVAAFVLALFILIILHEFAHAVICRYYGGEVREIGFLLMFLQPCFYCDVSDAWLFPKRSHRLAVTAAGPIFQLFVTAVAVIVWRVTVPGTFVSEVSRILATVSWVTYLFNFNPLIKLDGYYLLSDWLEIPNLRSKAFSYLRNLLKRRLLGWPVEPIEVTRRERRILTIYAVLALMYTSLLVGVLVWLLGRALISAYGGLGFLLLSVLLLAILWRYLSALVKGIWTHIRYMRKLLQQPMRLLIHTAIVVVVVGVTLVVRVPNRVSGDVIVKPIAEFRLSMNDFGLIQTNLHRGGESPEDQTSIMQMNSSEMGTMDFVPLVTDGQLVRQNDTLAILASNQIVQEIGAAEAELERLRSQLTLLRTAPKIEEINEAEARVTAANALYEKQQTDFERAEGLARKDLISSQQLEDARSALDIARANLQSQQSALDLLKAPPRPEEEAVLENSIEKQQSRLDFLRSQGDAQVIAAPFNGIVTRNPQQRAILSVIDHGLIELLVPVSDFDISRISLGQPVTVKVRSYPSRLFNGRVVRIPEAATALDGKLYFEVSAVIDNADRLLHDGMTGYAKVEVGESSILALIYRKVLSRIRVEFWSWW